MFAISISCRIQRNRVLDREKWKTRTWAENLHLGRVATPDDTGERIILGNCRRFEYYADSTRRRNLQLVQPNGACGKMVFFLNEANYVVIKCLSCLKRKTFSYKTFFSGIHYYRISVSQRRKYYGKNSSMDNNCCYQFMIYNLISYSVSKYYSNFLANLS